MRPGGQGARVGEGERGGWEVERSKGGGLGGRGQEQGRGKEEDDG